jgi:hypothetical protein
VYYYAHNIKFFESKKHHPVHFVSRVGKKKHIDKEKKYVQQTFSGNHSSNETGG